MDYYVRNTVFVVVLFLSSMMGLVRYRSLDAGGRILLTTIMVSLLGEATAFYMAIAYRHNHIAYNIASVVYIFLISLYFNQTIRSFRKRHIGIIIGICSIAIGIANNFFTQAPSAIISYFLIYEAVLIIALSITCLMGIIPRYENYQKLTAEPRYWVSMILMLYWSSTYMLWTLMDYYFVVHQTLSEWVQLSLFLLNCLATVAFTLLFFYYPKMQRSGR